MAFSFFGTFSTGQWEAFLAFTRIQRLELVKRRAWLQKQLAMNGIFVTEYDGPVPVRFDATAGSFAWKLLQAYRVLGGVPEQDMLLRTSDKPVFKTKAQSVSTTSAGETDGGFSDVYSNGRRDRGTQRFDRDLGLRVEKLKSWQLEAVKAKREALEFKIKRAMDYSDQLKREIDVLDHLLDESSLSSFEGQIVAVETKMATPEAMNVVQDLDDVHGLSIGKPGDLSLPGALEQGEQQNQRVPT